MIKTNDPNQKLVNYHITLNKNAAPVVTLPGGTTTVAEAQTALLPVTVADEEGEAFTVEVADKSGIATLAGYTIEGEAETTPAEGTATISVPEGKSLTISMKLQPQYGDEGMHTVAITATDASGNTATVEAPYSVEHTNRAPLYVGPSEISLGQGETSAANVFSQMFTDADDDQMTYVATIANQTVAGLYTEQSGFIIQARKKGQTTVTVTATDQNGAATSGTINVSVTDASGIGSATAGGSQRPAVAQQDGKVTLTLPQAVARARVEIYNNAGQTVALLTPDDVEAGSVISLPVDSQPAGVYHLKATLDGKTATLKFVKR